MAERKREFHYTRQNFECLRAMSNEHSGIMVPDDKFDMFYSRLSKHLRRLGLNSFSEYCELLTKQGGDEFSCFINSITTNLTSFFRENHHFEYLKNTVIPELLKKNATEREIRIWSAGCSTGEEAYSIAMTLVENLPGGWRVKILATDLDTDVLATASNGIYPQERIQGMPADKVQRWFMRGKGPQTSRVQIRPVLQSIITFRQLNLMGPWPMRRTFDCIFCRNVLIYFDQDTKKQLVNRFADILADQSYLFIGHSESLHRINTRYQFIGKTIYQKENPADHAQSELRHASTLGGI